MADKRGRERGNSLPRDDETDTKYPKLGSGGFPDYDKKLLKDKMPKLMNYYNLSSNI